MRNKGKIKAEDIKQQQPREVPANMEIPLVLNAGDIQNIMLALDEIPHKVAKAIEPKLQNAVIAAISKEKEFKESDSAPKDKPKD